MAKKIMKKENKQETKQTKMKLFSDISELMDLSRIPESPKKRVMTKNVDLLKEVLEEQKVAEEKYTKAKSLFSNKIKVDSLSSYKLCKIAYTEMADAENEITICKSDASKYINRLIFDHICSSNKHNKLTADELYQIVYAYETDQFKDYYFPKKRLRAICKNNSNYREFQFELEAAKAAASGEFKASKFLELPNKKSKAYWQKQIPILEKKILLCKDRRGSLYDTFLSMQYAKLIKKFDKLVHKHDEKNKGVVSNDNSGQYVIDLHNLSKYYYNKWMATKVLKGFDLKIKRGEFVVILGPSGSGKTTLLNIISGMDKATYGTTIVNGQNLIKMSDSQLTTFRRDNIGYIFQQYGLLPNLNVRENVEMGWNLQSDKSKRLDIDELLKTVGMAEHAKKFPHELSGGQQQRVSVARSMAKNPAIVFGDEPTGAVDEEMSKQILQLFVDINKKFNTTVIIVTHNPIFADLATRVIKVNSGYIAHNIENKHPRTVDQLDWSSNH